MAKKEIKKLYRLKKEKVIGGFALESENILMLTSYQ